MKNRFAAFVWWIGAIFWAFSIVYGLHDQYTNWKFRGTVNIDLLVTPIAGAGICALAFGICYVVSGSFWKPPRSEE